MVCKTSLFSLPLSSVQSISRGDSTATSRRLSPLHLLHSSPPAFLLSPTVNSPDDSDGIVEQSSTPLFFQSNATLRPSGWPDGLSRRHWHSSHMPARTSCENVCSEPALFSMHPVMQFLRHLIILGDATGLPPGGPILIRDTNFCLLQRCPLSHWYMHSSFGKTYGAAVR